MKKLKKFNILVAIVLIVSMMLCACSTSSTTDNQNPSEEQTKNEESENTSTGESEIEDNNEVKDLSTDSSSHNFTLTSQESGTYTFTCQDDGCTEVNTLTAKCEEGTDCITVANESITFGEITENTTYSLSGTFYGNIVINVGDDYEFELSLEGLTITSEKEPAINIESGDEVTISAKKNTENYIYDTREEITDDEDISATIYSVVDLNVQGKGSLYVKSNNNNGIHTKDELSLKNLTLEVDCIDNALKGNDGVTIESGNITLIARGGDAIKTTNSHLSSKGKQKGDITISGGNILLYSACDGIDASHDVIINEEEASVNLQVFTDKYSKYSEEVTATESDVIYVSYNNTNYKYSIEYSNGSSTGAVWYNSSSYKTQNGGMGRAQYYYSITKPSGYTKVRLFIYSNSQEQGQSTDYVACTDYLTINNNYDTLALESRGSETNIRWTNYSTTSMDPRGGMDPGMGGMEEGNTDKGDYSTKGIKADNEISITAGTITISAYDDAIHTNNDVELGEEGAYYYGTGNIVISGGDITIHSNDDGIHADGTLTVSNGTIDITNSYEGLEGTTITIAGGDVTVISSDDGMNSTATTGTGITISDGNIYVYAGGDGLDSNTKTSYSGLNISGGHTVVISTGNGDSSLDTENGYTYTGGYVVAIGGGMSSQESTRCSNFNSVGTKSSISISKDSYLVVEDLATIKMPVRASFVVVLGKTSANISSATSSSLQLNDNGVLWSK